MQLTFPHLGNSQRSDSRSAMGEPSSWSWCLPSQVSTLWQSDGSERVVLLTSITISCSFYRGLHGVWFTGGIWHNFHEAILFMLRLTLEGYAAGTQTLTFLLADNPLHPLYHSCPLKSHLCLLHLLENSFSFILDLSKKRPVNLHWWSAQVVNRLQSWLVWMNNVIDWTLWSASCGPHTLVDIIITTMK